VTTPTNPTSNEKPYEPQVRDIIYFPGPRLIEQSRWYDLKGPRAVVAPWGTQDLSSFAADLVATMKQYNGVGLAAVQVGVLTRIFVIAGKDPKVDAPIVMANPTWRPDDPLKEFYSEGCLSFPEVFEDVERYRGVEATWFDLDGKEHFERFTGVQAHAIQHETEHLDGHLFIEHLPITKRERVRTKMKQRARLTKRVDKVLGKGRDKQPSIQALISSGMLKLPTRPGFRSGR
jgi:peptide deformylase